jgi:hypothetical protein
VAGNFKIFLSHKNDDNVLADRLKTILTRPCPNGLDVFHMSDIKGGHDWCKKIYDRTASADMLWLLFTDACANWDWCMYEAGLFHAKSIQNGQERGRLVWLHETRSQGHALEAPSPLLRYQSTEVKRTPIESLLWELYTENYQEDEAGRKKQLLNADDPKTKTDIRKATNEIVNAFRMRKKRPDNCTPLGRHVVIEWPKVKGRAEHNLKELPDDATVTGDLGVFDVDRKSVDWKGLKENATLHGENWISQLVNEVHNIKSGRPPGIIRSCVSKYRPVVAGHSLSANPPRLDLAFYQEDAVPILNFDDLIDRLMDLLNNSDDEVNILALTPALGFLTKKEHWSRLGQALTKHAHRICMTSQTRTNLRTWHAAFRDKKRAEGDWIREDEIAKADEAAEDLRKKFGKYNAVEWTKMPAFYLFSNSTRAIIATPFSLPRLDIDDHLQSESAEMFGVESYNSQVVRQVNELQSYYARRFVPDPPEQAQAARA